MVSGMQPIPRRMSVHDIIPRLGQLNSELLNKASLLDEEQLPSREIAQAAENLRDAARLVRAAELALRKDERHP
jgi:hypothetical protein